MPRKMSFVTRVIDGDTFKIKNDITIRIAEIDAPEWDTLAGKNAAHYLKSLIEFQPIIYENQGTGYYGRMIAKVWRKSDNLNIGDAMICARHAINYCA